MSKRISKLIIAVLVLQSLAFAPAPKVAEAIIVNGAPAIDVIGQYDGSTTDRLAPIFTKSGANDGPNLLGLQPSNQRSNAIDTVRHRLFVPDVSNHRVLVFNLSATNTLTDRVPDFVLGQSNFSTVNTALTQSNMASPSGVFYDAAQDRLFVGESFPHNRVIVFSLAGGITNGMNASFVLGQPDFTTGTGTATQSGMNGLKDVVYDAAGQRLFISDSGNHRVIVYDISGGITNGMNATYVLGQPNFTSNAQTLSQSGMSIPRGIAYDAANQRLFVGESGNRRILVFDVSTIANGENAVNVLGQPNFTSNTSATTQAGVGAIGGVVYDAANQRLFAGDTTGNRVVVHNLSGGITDGMNASFVLGQPDFTTGTAAATQAGLSSTQGLGYDPTNQRLYVTDLGNNRIIVYDVASIVNGENAIDLIGQYVNNDPTNITYTKGGANNGPNNRGINGGTFNSGAESIAIDQVRHRLFYPDGNNHRVLVFNLHSDDTPQDKLADFVLGQPDFQSHASATTQSGMKNPRGAAYDPVSDRLFVADFNNHRTLVYDLSGGITNGMNASFVLGQPDFTSNTAATTQSGANGSTALWVDSVNRRLFVSEAFNRRVLVYDISGVMSNGMNASFVLGKPDFVTGGNGTTQSYLTLVNGVSWDPAGKRLFVADQSNNRIMVWDLSSGITNGMNASFVLGQPDFVTSTANTTQSGLNLPVGVDYDVAGQRLFVSELTNNRVKVWNLSGGITNGMNASFVLGQPDFVTSTANTTQSGLSSPLAVAYAPTNQRLFTYDGTNNRILIFDVSTATGTLASTVTNKMSMTRLKAGATSTFDISFTLTHNLSSTLTVTFPAGFTVTAAATGGSSCLSGFGFTATTLTATKTNCAGPITMTGATVTNPVAPGVYQVTWVNDDPGGGSIIITSDDQVSITGAVDPVLTFNVGSQASATACDGTFTGNGGTIALGVIATGAVTSSDAASVAHICTRVTTNGTLGALITVKSLNASLKSTSTPADAIPSSTATLAPGTAGYGLCAGSAGADSSKDATTPVGATPTRSAPFNGASCTSSGHDIGALTSSAQTLWTLASASQNAFFRLYIKAAVSPTTPAHNDYADTLTFVATGTY